eukprot:1205494-Rhodomonas_salina.1
MGRGVEGGERTGREKQTWTEGRAGKSPTQTCVDFSLADVSQTALQAGHGPRTRPEELLAGARKRRSEGERGRGKEEEEAGRDEMSQDRRRDGKR